MLDNLSSCAVPQDSDDIEVLLQPVLGAVAFLYCPEHFDKVSASIMKLHDPKDPLWTVKIVKVKERNGFSIRMPKDLLRLEDSAKGVKSFGSGKAVDTKFGGGTWMQIPASARIRLAWAYKRKMNPERETTLVDASASDGESVRVALSTQMLSSICSVGQPSYPRKQFIGWTRNRHTLMHCLGFELSLPRIVPGSHLNRLLILLKPSNSIPSKFK